jgi:6-phosphogluconolactonase
MNLIIKKFQSPNSVAEACAEVMHNRIQKLLLKKEQVNLALSGGSTPKILFTHLVNHYREKLPWEKLHLYWVDERCVPPDDPQSNYLMTNEYLLQNINIPAENIHRMQGESDPESEAARYSDLLKKNLPLKDNLPVFDLVILGMGDDGHTASIFPDQMELLQAEQYCAVGRHPESGQQRITLTGQVINHANWVAFMVTGQSKAEMVRMVLSGDIEALNYPAAHIRPLEGILEWYLDHPAGQFVQVI